ncbi:MAG: hypothetical protein DRP95_03840, partial [Candidatus Latescibacterota bacterium]
HRALYDAIYAAATLMGNATERKAAVLISSGPDDGSVRGFKETVYHALLNDMPVFVIGLDPLDEITLREIAAVTGGRYYRAISSAELIGIYERIAEVLHHQYQIIYSTHNTSRDGIGRTLSITCTYDSRTGSDAMTYRSPKDLEPVVGWPFRMGPDPRGSRFYPQASTDILPIPFGLKWSADVKGLQILTGGHPLRRSKIYHVVILDMYGFVKEYEYKSRYQRTWGMSVVNYVDALGCIDDGDGDGKNEVGVGSSELIDDRTPGIGIAFHYASITRMETMWDVVKEGGVDARGWPVCVLTDRIIVSFDADASGYPRGPSAFNRLSGYEIWHYKVGPKCEVSSIADIDNDYKMEIALSLTSADNGVVGDGWNGNGTPTSDAYFYTIVVDEDGEEILTVDYSADGENTGSIRNIFVDLNKDGKWEILALESHDAKHPGTSQIHLLDPSTGAFLKTFDGPINTSWSHPVVADVNGDGKDEVVVSRYLPEDSGYVGQYVLSSDLSVLTYREDPGEIQFANDLDGDGDIEVVLITEDTLKVVDGELSEEWRFVAKAPITSAIVSDTDGNGRNEILLLADKLYALEGGIEGLNVTINQLPSPPETFPTVKAYVTVTDKDDQPIRDLTAEHFTVTEDGVEQTPIQVHPAREEGGPISVVLVLDYSSSMYDRSGTISNMETAARKFISLMEPSDQAAIVKFSTEVEIIQNFTEDQASLTQAIDTPFAGTKGSTSFYDAIYQSAGLAAGESGRKAIVIITDAEDNSSTHSKEEAIAQAIEAGVPVFAIGLGSVKRSVLEEVTDRTGGHTYLTSDVSTLEEIYTLISQTLQSQYEITYTTSNLALEDSVRTVSIRVTWDYLTGEYTGSYRIPGERTGIEEVEGVEVIPTALRLFQNHPNPFNTGTTIRYHLPQASQVKLMIYDVLGRKIRTLEDGWQEAGVYVAKWDGTDSKGNPVGSGVYLVRLEAGSYHKVRKMVLVQ